MAYRVLVTGSRDFPWTRKHSIYEELANVVKIGRQFSDDLIISQGGASGVDAIALAWAENHSIPVVTFKADWSFGRSAGPMRNQRMLDEFRPHYVLAWPECDDRPGSGTWDMIRRCRQQGYPVQIFGDFK